MKAGIRLLGVTLAVSFAAAAQQYVISTFAGGVPPPNPISGVQASIGTPQGVAVDTAGNVYFTGLNCVFKLDSSEVITRVAGRYRAGYAGDGGPATSAQLGGPFQYGEDTPLSVAVDASGNLFIADAFNNRIRKVSATGTITTVAGGGSNGAGDGGPATDAQLASPSGVAVDARGNLFIADTFNDRTLSNRIRKVSPTGIITTVVGLGNPRGVALDASGNLYVLKVSAAGIITTVAGGGSNGPGDGGLATDARLASPSGVAVDAAGNLFFADLGLNDQYLKDSIRKVSVTGIITTVAGGGHIFADDGRPQLSFPQGVAVDANGNLFIADTQHYRMLKLAATGIITPVAGNGSYSYSGDGGLATNAQIGTPTGVAVDAVGNVFIADADNHRIRKVSATGIITVVGTGSYGNSGSSGDGGPATSAQINRPIGLAVDASGNLFFADSGSFLASSNDIRKVSATGIITKVAGGYGYAGDGGPAISAQINTPSGVAVDASGNLFFADSENSRIRKVSATGIITTVAGTGSYGRWGYSGDGGPATSAELNRPQGVAVDVSGNLFIADSDNRVIRKVSPTGIITTVTNQGYGALAVAVDASGNILYSEYNRILEISTAGIITPVAGNGLLGYSGDGGPATMAQLDGASGIAIARNGNVYIADSLNHAIRMLTPAGSSSVPSVTDGGIVNAASFTSPVAPGGIVSLFGNFLVTVPEEAKTLPIQNTLGGLSLQFSGVPLAPLFFAGPTQTNAQIPWELAGQTQTTVVAIFNGQSSSAQTVSLAAYAPGIFVSQPATALGAIVDSHYLLVDSANPATAGSTVVQIFCTGLGPVTNQPATGAASPGSPLAWTTTKATATIGGMAADVSFSGLAPGFVGLYQVNALVPPGSAKGGAVPVTIAIGGVSSNTVTIAVQ
jgi:uncharacterized protein (TIGR03437 family)